MNQMHEIIKICAKKKILYTVHAIKQMNKEERLILHKEVEFKIFKGQIIEEYPEDKRGHSVLINGEINKRPIHVVCAPKEDYLAIITAYLPDRKKWANNFTKRKKP